MSVALVWRFHDERRFRSAEVKRAFISVIQAASLGSQCELLSQQVVTIEPDVADTERVRRVANHSSTNMWRLNRKL
jgi:hypothetical protein